MKLHTLWCHAPAAGRHLPHAVLRSKAEILDILGHWPEAIAIYQRSIDFALSIDRPDIAAANGHDLARVLLDMGRYDDALASLDAARRLAAEAGDEDAATKVAATTGIVHWYRGELTRATECLEQLVPVYQRRGDRVSLSNLYNNLGNAWADRGDYRTAERYYRDQIAICRDVGHLDGLQRGLGNLAILHQLAGEYETALALHQEKLAISRKLGNRKSSNIAIGNIGVVYSDMGRFDEALECFRQKREICRFLGDPLETALAAGNIGIARQRQGGDEAALACFTEAIDGLRALGARYHLSEFLSHAAEVQLRLGDAARAAALCREAGDVAREMNQTEQAGYIAVLECRIQGAADPAGARLRLEAMAAAASDDKLLAVIAIELYRLTRDETHRQRALAVNRALYAKVPCVDWRQAIEELERQR